MKKGKRNLLALLMAALLCFSELGSLTGRASDDEPEKEVNVSGEAAEEDHYAPVPVQAAPEPDLDRNAEEGKVLNIYTWNREFPDLVTTYYPGYTVVDDTHGKIGDVDVVWSIVPKNNVQYVNNLYSKLFMDQSKLDPDERVDIYLAESDLVCSSLAYGAGLPLKELGIDSSMLDDQFEYTKHIGSDKNGALSALSWQAHAGGMLYNREAAKAVLGSDDPAVVQAAVSSWDKFGETALLAKEKGYTMCSAYDTYRPYYNNLYGRWVADNTVYIDDKVKEWVKASKALLDAGAESSYSLWSNDWNKGLYPDGKTFCYFVPQWAYEFSMSAAEDGSIGNIGGWGYTEGPESYYWGGNWIVPAYCTDNKALVKDILLKMTTDPDILKSIAKKDRESVNSKKVMEELSTDPECNSSVLGGQNPYKAIKNNAEKLNFKGKLNEYDQGLAIQFQELIKRYFKGEYTMDQVIEAFYSYAGDYYYLKRPTPGQPTPTSGWGTPTATPTPKADDPTPGPDVEVVEVKPAELVVKGKIDAAAWIQGQCPEIGTIDKIKLDNTKAAKANKKGIITAKKEGTVTVTASVKVDKKNYKDVATFKLTVQKPVLSFKGKDLTYSGAELDANDFITNVPESAELHWSVPAKKTGIVTIDENSGAIKAGDGKGAVTVSCSIRSYGFDTVYKAKINVKKPKIKEMLKIKDGKSKKLSISNVSAYTAVEWASSSPAVAIEKTAKQSAVKLTVNSTLDPEISTTPAVVTATIDGQEYKTTIQIK